MSAELGRDPAAQPSSPPRRASERLRDCSHLVGLLADQLEALEQGDFPRLRELDALRVRLAGEVREEGDEDAPLLECLLARMEAALARVEAWMESDRRTRDELTHLQEESLPLIRGIPRSGGGGQYRPLDGGSARLDVRL